MITAVPRHPVLGSDARPRRLQQVELRGDLKQSPLQFGVGVHGPCLTGDTPHGAALVTRYLDARTQFGQRRHFKAADAIALVVDRRDQHVVLNDQSATREVVALFPKAHEIREPVLRHSEHGFTGVRHLGSER